MKEQLVQILEVVQALRRRKNATEAPGDECVDLVLPCALDTELGNWEVLELPVVYGSDSK